MTKIPFIPSFQISACCLPHGIDIDWLPTTLRKNVGRKCFVFG